MIKVSNEELKKIGQFMSCCEDMINGKFILADTKIKKILNMVAESEELYRYISECLMDYDFSREYFHASVRNNINGGVFQVPSEQSKLVAFVFCFLVECDAGRIDFFTFINENFKNENKNESYKAFAKQLLVPFKEIIASRFSFGGVNDEEVQNLANTYRQDLMENPVFEQNQYGQTNFEQNIDASQYGQYEQYQVQQGFENANIQNGFYANQNVNIAPAKPQAEVDDKSAKKDVWAEMVEICSNVESAVYAEHHLKEYLKEELLYILGTIKYSTKYKDARIISALVTAFDELSKKFRSIQFVFGELKNKIQSLYE